MLLRPAPLSTRPAGLHTASRATEALASTLPGHLVERYRVRVLARGPDFRQAGAATVSASTQPRLAIRPPATGRLQTVACIYGTLAFLVRTL